MQLVRKLAALLALGAAVCLAQSPPRPNAPFIGGQAYASVFGSWAMGASAQGAGGGAPGSITMDVAYVTIPGGLAFEPFFVGNKLIIQDGANTETVTITSTNCKIGNNAPCNVGANFANAHSGRVQINSGTDGLLEAISALTVSGGTVVLTPDWAGTTAMITGATNGGAGTEILDQRTGQATWYGWNGSAYQIAFSINNPPAGISNITVTTSTIAGVNETLKQKSGQTGDLLDFQSAGGTGGDLAKVDSAGNSTWPTLSLTGAAGSAALTFAPTGYSPVNLYLDTEASFHGFLYEDSGLHLASSLVVDGAFQGNKNGDGIILWNGDSSQPLNKSITLQAGDTTSGNFKMLADAVETLPDITYGSSAADSGYIFGANGTQMSAGVNDCFYLYGSGTEAGAGAMADSGFGCSTNITFKTAAQYIGWNDGTHSLTLKDADLSGTAVATLPNPGANYTLAGTNFTNGWTAQQDFDAGIALAQTSAVYLTDGAAVGDLSIGSSAGGSQTASLSPSANSFPGTVAWGGGAAVPSSTDTITGHASLTTTAATSNAATVIWSDGGTRTPTMCTFSAANSGAAADIASDYISAYGSNSVTLTHTATASLTYTFICTP